eukprot:6203892-Pleurochrysis_carterae.AAC.7
MRATAFDTEPGACGTGRACKKTARRPSSAFGPGRTSRLASSKLLHASQCRESCLCACATPNACSNAVGASARAAAYASSASCARCDASSAWPSSECAAASKGESETSDV